MDIYWEDATKRLQEELNDPLLRVIYDTDEQKYQVLKWFEDWDSLSLLVDGKPVNLYYPTGYYHFQLRFDEWDNRVFQKMRAGRAGQRDIKYILHDLKAQDESVKTGWDKQIEEIGHEMGKDLWYAHHPRLITHARQVN